MEKLLMMPRLLFLVMLSRVAADLTTPSSLLGPRHYNHHPYEQYLKETKPTKQGPVLFPNDAPPPPRPPLVVTSRPLIESIARSDLNPPNPLNNSVAEQSQVNGVYLGRVKGYQPNHDYEVISESKDSWSNQDYLITRIVEFEARRQTVEHILCGCHALARQRMKEFGNGYPEPKEQQPTLPPIYRAISDHAKQNLRLQQQKPVYNNYKVKEPDYSRQYESNNVNDDDNNDYNPAQNYAFSYIVRDQKTGDDFSHSQHSSGSATNGEYRVRLPDGRMQIVSYTADENGYNANVRYDDEKATGNSIDYNVNRNFNNDYNSNHKQAHVSHHNGNYARNQNENYINNADYNAQNYNYDYKDNQDFNVKRINDLNDNSYVQNEETKPVTENHKFKDDYQYTDSKEYYGNDYSLEYDGKYDNYDPYKSKFTAFSGHKNPTFIPKKTYSTASTVRPSYEELKPLFVQTKPFKSQSNNEYLYSKLPFQINVPSTTPSPYFDSTTERVVIIGTTKPNLYTNIRSSIAPIPVTPVPKYSSSIVTPRSFLASTVASFVNLKKNIDFSGAKPVLTNTFIDKINRYLSYT